ncbi:MAG TPA: hypothetical protein VMW65_18110 [Chloroflexota bacterium]|nr:hypothetical protein [Chloroflexota bacterium]
MKQGAILSYLHHDHLGSLVAATDPSGNELGSGSWARYSPFGQLRTLSGSVVLPSDRLFTGQTRDHKSANCATAVSCGSSAVQYSAEPPGIRTCEIGDT